MKRGTPDHPKMYGLALRLGISRAHATGLMEMLWHWTARFSPRGDIGKWPDSAIEAGAGWEGEPGVFISGLKSVGWVDENSAHRLIIHDWADHVDDTTRKFLSRNNLEPVRTLSRNVQTFPDISPLPIPEPIPEPQPKTRRTKSAENGIGGFSEVDNAAHEILAQITTRHKQISKYPLKSILVQSAWAEALGSHPADTIEFMHRIDKAHAARCKIEPWSSGKVEGLDRWLIRGGWDDEMPSNGDHGPPGELSPEEWAAQTKAVLEKERKSKERRAAREAAEANGAV